MSRVLAVDLGGTKTSIAAVDNAGRISDKQKIPAASNFGGSIEQIVPRPGIAAAGVIVPGIYDPQAGTAWAPNLWGRDFYPLRDVLEQRLGVPVAIGSDRTGSVLAEQWLGIARGFEHVLFVAVGTGIGVGILFEGRPLEGAHGIAGAAGWMPVGGPWKPEYTERGCWESEAAGPALARRAGMATAKEVVAAARAGDAKALTAVRETADYLAMGIAALIAVLDPEMVVLGGGLMQAGDLMLERIRRLALSWTQPVAARKVRVEATTLGEDAGLLGAGRLGWLRTGKKE
ncbi:MAG TPA: ROK family protein [Candidatus Acidoferrales bacterium]|nr:ROK family protein [Candidatus Acidoferrales bacterium]